ncbi:MAG: DUF2058 domain-containing protein [Gammaproteobacteria bacterium]
MSQKKLSLQEQLLKAGLVSVSQAKTAKSEKYKQNQLKRNPKVQIVDEAKELALKAQADQIEKDRQLNKLKQQQEQQKQIAAQVRQLVMQHRIQIDENAIDQYDDSFSYHFIDNGKVKKLFVPQDIREQIAGGRLAIVKLGQRYEVVKTEIAIKIKARDPGFVVMLNESTDTPSGDNDDPYSAYQIPDDLMW